jgi:peptidase E
VSKKPIYLLAGGNWRHPGAMVPLIETVLAETGTSRPTVAHVGAANGDSRMFQVAMKGLLAKGGMGKLVPVKLAHEKADRGAAVKAIGAADAVFIAGGDVEEGMRWINRHRMGPALHEAYARGAVVFGISAGSIMLGTHWVRWRDPDDDGSAELFDCLGLARVICDTHAEADGWAELDAAMRLAPADTRGFGIPTGGALRVGPRGGVDALVTAVTRRARSGRGVEADGDLLPVA